MKVIENPLASAKPLEIKRADIDEQKKSPTSMMSKGLVDKLTRDEFAQGFAGWFEKWNTDKSGTLTDEQLRAGIDRDLGPPRGGGPGGPGSGPRPNAPPPAP